MLINTLLLFLRDVLPVFITISLLMAGNRQINSSNKWWNWSIMAGLAGVVGLVSIVDSLTDSMDGSGMEVMMFGFHLIVYMAMLTNAWSQSAKPPKVMMWKISALTLLTVTMFNSGTNFLIFFFAFWLQTDAAQGLILGAILGMGICVSVATLMYYFTTAMMKRFGPSVQLLILLLFSCGQFSRAIHLLVQIDWLEQTHTLWNTQQWIADSSVSGYFLKSIIGYEAAPTVRQIVLYILTAIVPIALYAWQKRYQRDVDGASSAG